jgi:3-methyl-2-oxobutanoate hydroxymethyltransferase
MAARFTVRELAARKAGSKRIVCVTAYDAFSGSLAQEAGVDVVLVGDSLGNVVQGCPTTHGVTLADVCYHLRAVRRQVDGPMLVADLPFGTYQSSVAQAVDSAVELVRHGAEAVKLEGGFVEAVAAIARAGIPVWGHVGFTPQSVLAFGGFRVQGKGSGGEAVACQATALEEAGACAIVLELIPSRLAAEVTERASVPTIGIGAGPACDGEIQVFHDILGLGEREMRHSRAFVPGRKLLLDALREYVGDVREGRFPTEENST